MTVSVNTDNSDDANITGYGHTADSAANGICYQQ